MATRSLGTLTLDLVMKIGGFREGMDEAARITDQRTKEMRDKAAKFGAAFGKALAVAGTAAVAGIGLISNQVRRAIDDMADLQRAAERVGTTTKEFTGLAYAAKTVHVEVQDLQDALSGMYGQIANGLNATSDQGKLFEALNINLRDSQGHLKNTTQLLKELADAYVRTGGSAEILVAGDTLMGDDFKKLIPLLKQGSKGIEDLQKQAEALGITFDEKTGRAAEQFQAKVEQLQGAWTGLWRQLAVKLLPVFDELVDKTIALSKDQHGLAQVASVVEATFRGLMAIGQGLGIVFDSLLLSMKTVVAAAKPALDASAAALLLMSGNLKGAKAYMEDFKTDSATAAGFVAESWGKATEDIKDHWNSLVKDMNGGGAKTAALPALPAFSRGDGSGAAIQNALSGTTPGGSATKKLGDSIAKLQATVRKTLRSTDAQLTASIEQDAMVSVQAWEAAQQALVKYGDAEQQQVATQKLVNEQIAMLNETLLPELVKQNISVADAHDIVAKKAKAMVGQMSQTTDQLSQFAKQAANNMQDAFADFLFDPFEGGLKGMLDSFTDTLRRMAANAAASALFKELGAAATSSNNKDSFWGRLIAGFFGGGKASGGTVRAGHLYRVNEEGPELASIGGRDYLMMGAQNGTITPNAAMASGGAGSVQFKFIFEDHTNSGVSVKEGPQSVDSGGSVVKRFILSTVAEGYSPGGPLDKLMAHRYGARGTSYG